MKKLKMQTIGMLFIAILVGNSTNTFAQCGNGNWGYANGQENGQGYYCNNIPNLTTDQQNKIGKLATACLNEIQSLRNELLEKKAHLQTLRTTDKVDLVSINKTIDEISVIQTNMNKKREQYFQEVRGLLTNDQKAVFDTNGNGCCNGNGNGRTARNGNGCCGRGC